MKRRLEVRGGRWDGRDGTAEGCQLWARGSIISGPGVEYVVGGVLYCNARC